MTDKKQEAITLRKQGKSYNEINQILGVPKSTLSNWFSRLEWSRSTKVKLMKLAQQTSVKHIKYMNERRIKKFQLQRENARKEAVAEFYEKKKDQLFVAGLMLYWGEGDSKVENSIVRLSNTSAEMIKIYCLFLNKICGVPLDKIKASMILYPDLNEGKCLNHWSRVSGIKKRLFYKTQYIRGKHPTKRLQFGICNVQFSNRLLKEKIFVWIDLFQKQYPLMRE